jgi:hypothetical protein
MSLNIDWTEFLGVLPLYQSMVPGARRFFLDQVRPSQPVPISLLGPWREPLLASGLVSYGATKVNVNVKPEYRGFSKTIRAMGAGQVLHSPSPETLQSYLDEHLTTEQLAGFAKSGYYSRMDFRGRQEICSTVTSASWPRQFLASENGVWERKYLKGREDFYTSPPGVLDAAKLLLQKVIDENAPLRLSHLPQLCPELQPAIFSAALNTLFRYLLLFAAVDPEDFDPVVGAWPGIAKRLSSASPVPPVAVEVSEAFQSPFQIDDMVVVLSACVVEPIRLRTNDRQIFEASRQALAADLGTLPGWFDDSLQFSPEYRISLAINCLADFDFLKQSGRPGTNYSLKATEAGFRWLSLAPKEKLRAVLDGILGATEDDSQLYARESMPLVPDLHTFGTRVDPEQCRAAVIDSWTQVPTGAFIRLGDFLSFHARVNNPLAVQARKDRNFTLSLEGRYLSAPNDEELEAAWQRLLYGFLKFRLLPLGGVRAGVESGGSAISVSLSGIGAYLLGAAKDFELASDAGARILVQPNFDIVFLAPSARLESEFSRFAERTGRHVGTLFRITKASVMLAAAAGYSAERVLDLLRECAQAALPANVEKEIGGWFGRYRQVDIRPAVLIYCPDEETSIRVLTALGKSASRVSPTLLEFHRAKIPPAVAKKLRDAGVFIRTGDFPQA